MTLHRFLPFVALAPLALGTGCLLSIEDGGQPEVSSSEEEGLRLSCDANVSVDAEAEATVLVEAFRTSLSEMIGCGQLTADLAGGVQAGIIDAIIDNRPDATPGGWTYQGEGLFTTSGGQAAMETRFYLGADFEMGSAGDPVEHNVFLVDSYLLGANVRVPDPLDLEVELHWDEAGPLVELLGYGTQPPNPIIVDLGTLGTIGNRLSALHFESDIQVEEADGEETIRYDLHTERMEANALLLGSPLRYELGNLVARTDDTEITITDWSAEFFTSGQVEGSTSFDVQVDVDWNCEGTIVFPELPRPSGD